MSEQRAIRYRQRAQEMELRAAHARTVELSRSYMILARDWHEMADRQIQTQSPPLAPIGALEQLAIDLMADAEVLKPA